MKPLEDNKILLQNLVRERETLYKKIAKLEQERKAVEEYCKSYTQRCQDIVRSVAYIDLTDRQLEILKLIVKGIKQPQIAEMLGITLNTVMTHYSGVNLRAHCKRKSQVVYKLMLSGQIAKGDFHSRNYKELSEKELETLQCLSQGMSTKQIADYLIKAEPTISTHIARMRTKLNAGSRAEIIYKAFSLGYLDLDMQ